MEVKKLDFGETLKDSVAIGVKNAPSVIAAVALWLITIWIPYLNVGTTIAITLLQVSSFDINLRFSFINAIIFFLKHMII